MIRQCEDVRGGQSHPRGKSETRDGRRNDERRAHGSERAQCRADHRSGDPACGVSRDRSQYVNLSRGRAPGYKGTRSRDPHASSVYRGGQGSASDTRDVCDKLEVSLRVRDDHRRGLTKTRYSDPLECAPQDEPYPHECDGEHAYGEPPQKSASGTLRALNQSDGKAAHRACHEHAHARSAWCVRNRVSQDGRKP